MASVTRRSPQQKVHSLQKLRSLQAFLQGKNLGSALFVNREESFHPSMAYLLSLPASPAGFLVVPARGMPALILSPLDEAPRASCPVRVLRYGSRKKLHSLLKKQVRGKKFGLDMAFCSARAYQGIRKVLKKSCVDISLFCQQLRAVKTGRELAIMARACAISDEILGSCIARFSSFSTEKEAERFLLTETLARGCAPAFPPIIASGARAAAPHAQPKGLSLCRGFCVIDFGIRFRGYCTDTSRTIYLGTPSRSEKSAYELVRKTQESLIAEAVPGAPCASLHEKARAYLGHYARFFIHSLGHGVGMEIHEQPALAAGSKQALAPGMVITIEPGIYLQKKFGIRIEDTLVVSTKPRVLTKIPKELVCVAIKQPPERRNK